MSKFADRYFEVQPWSVLEKGFDPDYALVSESVFSLGNEYTGLRGYFEEGYSGDRLQGSYINGVYEQRDTNGQGYKGVIGFTEFMVNAVDWTYVRLAFNDVQLDLKKSRISDFKRELTFTSGLLTRSFVWHVDEETDVELSFERFLSMTKEHLAGQKIRVKVLKGRGQLSFSYGLDFSNMHHNLNTNLWDLIEKTGDPESQTIEAQTMRTRQRVFCQARTKWQMLGGFEIGNDGYPDIDTRDEKAIIISKQFLMEPGNQVDFEKLVLIDSNEKGAYSYTNEERLEALKLDYNNLKEESTKWWQRQWKISDIEIGNDPLNQQGIRFCIFQMNQTLHSDKNSAVIGAKGLTGEAYNGNTFWDSEVYCLPFYLFNNIKAAKSILKLRYDTLTEAKERAKMLDCEGAFYPIATISGHECCDLWQHASLQLQASTAVAYGLWNYEKISGDMAFVYKEGAEMLVEISKMLASRGDYDAQGQFYGYYGVMGPDEFQMMVNHNAYTNYMAKKTFEYTLDVLGRLEKVHPEAFNALDFDGDLRTRMDDWKQKADAMKILYDESSGLIEQHEGYYTLPALDIKSIPVVDFPLYHHWTYDRIYRNQMLKQPDVLMFMLMYNSDFSNDDLKVNYDFYEPKCIHESSLSPSVHSILAAQLGYEKEAYDFFGFATRMDLDNYNRNTTEGLHTTSIAGSWMNIVYGFGGLRSDGDLLTLRPILPEGWEHYRFSLRYEDTVIRVLVSQEDMRIHVDEGHVRLNIYDDVYEVTTQDTVVQLMKRSA